MQRSLSLLRKSNCTQCNKPRNGHPQTQRPPGSTFRTTRNNRIIGRPPQSSSRRACTLRALLQIARSKTQLGRDDPLPGLLRIRGVVVRIEGYPIQIASCRQLNQPGPTCGKYARRLVRRARHHRCGVRLQGSISFSSKVRVTSISTYYHVYNIRRALVIRPKRKLGLYSIVPFED